MRTRFGRFAAGAPWTAFAFGGRQRFFEPGEVRLAILSLLAEGPKHGYQLMKEMQERSGGVYSASAGTVYPTLQQLEDEGLIAAEMQGGRRVFTLTAEGRAELAKDPDAVREIWERAEACEDWGQYMTPEAFVVFKQMGPLIKASMRAAREGGVERVGEILNRARKELDKL
jgi:DNA-binding PadR family transcriptional regulator